MVEVFKTDVQHLSLANDVVRNLSEHLPDHKINFDLHDCDKILRVESEQLNVEAVLALVRNKGIYCEPLD